MPTTMLCVSCQKEPIELIGRKKYCSICAIKVKKKKDSDSRKIKRNLDRMKKRALNGEPIEKVLREELQRIKSKNEEKYRSMLNWFLSDLKDVATEKSNFKKKSEFSSIKNYFPSYAPDLSIGHSATINVSSFTDEQQEELKKIIASEVSKLVQEALERSSYLYRF